MIWSRSAFQSTQPEWAATRRWTAMTAISRYFNPRSPNGLRPAASTRSCELSAFQSTQPEWAATTPASFASCDCEFQSTQPEWAATMMRTTKKAAAKLFQSTQPEWAATRAPAWCDRHAGQISIHAARMGCDASFMLGTLRATRISIHAARMGCDSIRINCNYYLFYSYKSAKLTFLLN